MQTIKKQTWGKNHEYKAYFDDWMERLHMDQWAALVERIPEQDLTDKVVLDFGCNRGVSFQVLHEKRPFLQGYGIDLDAEAIHIAQERRAELPVTYQVGDNIKHLTDSIDIAFSHEVLYLIKDLNDHAQQIFNALKKNGLYYVALSAHANNPIWQKEKKAFAKELGIEVQDYTLCQITEVFNRQGFTTEVRKFRYDEFLQQDYFDYGIGHKTSIIDTLDHYSEYKVLFRFIK